MIITTRALKNLSNLIGDGTIRTSDVFEDGEKMKGKKWIFFTPYVHPSKSVEENFTNLQKQAKAIQSVFPDYTPPTKKEILSLSSSRKAMRNGMMKAGSIAEKSMPNSLDGWLSNV